MLPAAIANPTDTRGYTTNPASAPSNPVRS
jgi:hypothetical protein